MKRFSDVSEAQITRAIVGEFSEDFLEHVQTEAIIIGAGPSGLMAGRELANKGVKTVIIESNNYLGGGFWIGGYFMNTITLRAPAQKILQELEVPFREAEKGLFTTKGPHATAKLIASACEAGVKVLNLTRFEDIVLKREKACGAVINWSTVAALPRQITCADPVSLEAKVVIDATGHDAVVCRAMEDRGLLSVAGYGPMDADSSEDLIVEKTGQVYPGLFVTGMAVSAVYGIPRMGPTFGGMLESGRRVAQQVLTERRKKQSSSESAKQAEVRA